MRGIIAVISLMFCFQVSNALAGADEYESCRCRNELATKGDSKQEIQRKCGQPVLVKYNVRRDCDEMWLYNFGPNEFMQGVCFSSSGWVKKVLSLTRGY